MVASGFNFFVILALVMQVSILALLWAFLYKIRNKFKLGPNNLLELSISFCAGVAVLFVASFYYFEFVFQGTLLVGIVTAPVFVVYRMVEVWTTKKKASVPIQHLIRNTFVMVAVMAPLLIVAFFIVEPTVKSPLPIVGWAAGNTALGVVIFFRFLRERKMETPPPDSVTGVSPPL